MAEKTTNVFDTLYAIDVSDKTKAKNGLTYLPWASAWAEIKKVYPDATYQIYPQIMDEQGNTRFWHDDGKSGWVEVGVTINGVEQIEVLAIMDLRNKAIAADAITSVEANKAKQRCLVKALAMHGLCLHIYEGEDLPEAVTKTEELKEDVDKLVKKKCALGEKAQAKVKELCVAAEKEAFPDLEEDLVNGNYRAIEDIDILETLKRNLLAIRK